MTSNREINWPVDWAFDLHAKVRHVLSPVEGVVGIITARELYETPTGITRYYYVSFVGHNGEPSKENFRATAQELKKA